MPHGSFVRGPGAGRDPVKYACAALQSDFECFAQLLKLVRRLRRDDEQKRGNISGQGRVFHST